MGRDCQEVRRNSRILDSPTLSLLSSIPQYFSNKILPSRKLPEEEKAMRIRYNAPVTLTFALASALVLTIDLVTGAGLIPALFMVPGKTAFSFSAPLNYVRIFTHVMGHVSWEHLLSNFAIILLIGPILEEKYGTTSMILMIMITALVTGLLNALIFTTALLVASGVAFMMILLVSFTNIRNGEIPLTFLLILVLYLARELITSVQENQISEFAHIAGGACGSLFGFLRPRK
jgi:membrane associated rhomboid family serine protease